jgi:pimeloyl-ACP methyl ester carboxylesterase
VRPARPPPPLVLIPGAMATAVAWRYQISAFRSTREVIVPDRHFALETIQAMAQGIAARLPPLFDLAGWSMGGYIVFELYPMVSERIRRLVLICTMARADSAETRRRRSDLLRSVEAEGIRAVYERQIDCNLVNRALLDTDLREQVLTETERLGERTLRRQIEAMTRRHDSRRSLSQIACPTLVIGARHDTVTPVECSLEMKSLLPNATCHIVELAGHGAPWERSDEVNGVIGRFLES